MPDGLYDGTFFIIINEKKFKSLAAQDQAAILKVSGETLSRAWGQAFDRQMKAAQDKLKANGHVFTEPNAELLTKILTIRAQMLKELQAEGKDIGVPDYGQMVVFYEDQYKALNK